MAYTTLVNYVIWFADVAEYNAAVALAGGNGYGHCPFTAATTFGIPWPLVGGPLYAGTKGIYYNSGPPYAGLQINHPNPSGIIMDETIDVVVVPGQLGNPASQGMGQTCNFTWWGNIVFQSQEVSGAPPTTPIPQRRWIGGSEVHSTLSEGGSGGNAQSGSRSASRTIDGWGLPIRGSQILTVWLHTVDEFVAGLLPKTSWERFYVRVKTLGIIDSGIWRCNAKVNTSAGAGIKITAAGSIAAYTYTNGGVENLVGTVAVPPTLNQWYLIDVILQFNSGAGTDGRLRVYVNHTLEIDYADTTGNSLDINDSHKNSSLGKYTAADAQFCADLDDWICSDVPNNAGVESLDSMDWFIGSHVRRVNATAVALTNYVAKGSVEIANQNQNPEVISGVAASEFTSSTALATIEALMDVTDEQVFPGLVLGPVAACIGAYCFAGAGSPAARIGYKIAGGATVWTAVIDATTHRWVNILYRPSGLTLPTSIVPFSVLKEKSNDIVSSSVRAIGGVIEYIGVWGIEDNALLPVDLSNNLTYFHNARYANTLWGMAPLGPVDSPVYAIGGTYVGTDTDQSINLPAPAHFIWIRNITGAAVLGVKWFATNTYGHGGGQERGFAQNLVRSYVDSTGQAKFTVTGNGLENNKAGDTYQYIAFCDPGMRFNHCGVYQANTALATLSLSLFVSTFLAQFGFIHLDLINSTTTSIRLTNKGVGNGANDGQLVDGSAKANWGSFAAGALTVLADNINTATMTNYSLWRTTDSNGYVAVQITSYVGDGGVLQIVNLPITTGRWPLFAIVQPHGAVAYMRDPSHTGLHSCSVQVLTDGVTQIIGGAPDQIFVGVGLNALGTVYEVFVLMGDENGWNNGDWYPPDGPSEGTWTHLPYVPAGPGNGGLNLNGSGGILAVKNLSGIYTLVPNKLTDTIYTGFGASTIDVKKPDPTYKTGYIGG